MKFVIKSGYAQSPISIGLKVCDPTTPPNDVNKRFGNTAEVRTIIIKTKVVKKTPQVTMFENSDSSFLNSKILFNH